MRSWFLRLCPIRRPLNEEFVLTDFVDAIFEKSSKVYVDPLRILDVRIFGVIVEDID